MTTRADYYREWYEKNKDTVREYKKKYYKMNRDKIINDQKIYRSKRKLKKGKV